MSSVLSAFCFTGVDSLSWIQTLKCTMCTSAWTYSTSPPLSGFIVVGILFAWRPVSDARIWYRVRVTTIHQGSPRCFFCWWVNVKKNLIHLVIFCLCLNQCGMKRAYSTDRVNGPRMETWDLKISYQSTGRHKYSWKVNVRMCDGETGCKVVDP